MQERGAGLAEGGGEGGGGGVRVCVRKNAYTQVITLITQKRT